jgi:hypothetical protein
MKFKFFNFIFEIKSIYKIIFKINLEKILEI